MVPGPDNWPGTANTSGTWAAPADVTAVTGVTGATDAQLGIAGFVTDLYHNHDYSNFANVGWRDAKYLCQAVCYEYVWLQQQFDMFVRSDITAEMEGRRMVLLGPEALKLGPLAKLALDRVSWRRSRSLHVKSPLQDGLSPISPNPDSAANDEYEAWTNWSTGAISFGE